MTDRQLQANPYTAGFFAGESDAGYRYTEEDD